MATSLILKSNWLKSKYTESMTEKIGQGGYSNFYSFVDPKTGIPKALKVIDKPTDIDFTKWLQEASLEIDNMLELNECDQVLKLENHHIDIQTNRIFLVTELAANSMDKIKGRLSEDEMVKLCQELLSGLLYAHERKLVHRDIKPANILISKSGSFLISDWGISRTMDKKGTQSQRFTGKGTEGYIAPDVYEYIEGERTQVDLFKADIYAAGLLLLVGCGIAEKDIAKGIRIINKKAHQEDLEGMLKTKDPKFFPELDELIRKMTKFDPKERADIFEVIQIWKDMEKKTEKTKKLVPRALNKEKGEEKEKEILKIGKKIKVEK